MPPIDPLRRSPRLQRAFIDLSNPPPSLRANPVALQTAYELNTFPTINLDGDPNRFSWQELQAALHNPYVTAQAKTSLQWVAHAFFEEVPRFASAADLGIPRGLAVPRDQLIALGFEVFNQPYPQDLAIPSQVKQLDLGLPFPPGTHLSVQQANNTMCSPASHAPNGLRYALDFVLDGSADSRGAKVVSPEAGTAYVFKNARENKPDNWGFGNFVLLDHGNGYASLLAHLDSANVVNGQKVKKGELLGVVGATGSAGNPHLHYQMVQLTGTPDPLHQEYHAEFPAPGALPPVGSTPLPPFGQVVPYELWGKDFAQGGAARKIASTEFVGAQAGALPAAAGRYGAA